MPAIETRSATSVLPGIGIAPISTFNLISLDSVADTLTATASATQANAALLAARINRATTVAAGSGFRLPPAQAGMVIVMYNGQATNALLIFPSSAAQGGITGGDQINALGVNASYSLTASNFVTFRCVTNGQWYASQGALS